MAVREGEIRLDVVNGRPVHQVRTGDAKHRAKARARLHAKQPHGGKADGVRAERRARGEHAHALVAAKARRLHHGRPALLMHFGKAPDQPDMRESRKPAQRVRVPVFRLEHDHGLLFRHEAALPRDAELGCKIAPDARDHAERSGLLHTSSFPGAAHSFRACPKPVVSFSLPQKPKNA